jgi:thiaminase
MPSARQLLEKVTEDLRELDEALRTHPYPDAVARGEVSLEGLRAFPGHQYHIVKSDLRSMALMVHRFGGGPAHDFVYGLLQGEIAALPTLVAMAARLGMSVEDLERYEPVPEGFAYATNMALAAAQGSAAELACAMHVNFTAWGDNCRRLSEALRLRHGFPPEATAFLDAFATLPSMEESALALIQEGLDQGVSPREIHRAARLFQAYEKMFWDTLLERKAQGV